MPSESNTIDDFGKSITNDFNITVANLVVNEDALVKGDLTVLGALTYNELDVVDLIAETATINDLTAENATITNLTLENPLPTVSGGTGLATIGTAGQVLAVNSTGTGLVYTSNAEGSVTSVSALLPLASSGGTTPTISIPSTTGTGSTVVLNNTPSLIGPVLVTGDLNCEDGSVGLLARNTSEGTSASISMNTFSSKKSRIRTSNDVEFRIDNIGLGQRKKMKLMADSIAVTRSESDEQNDGFYVDFPTTIRNDTFIRDTYCSAMLNFPQSVSLANENGIRMYSGTNQDNPRIEMGITSGDFYPATSSSYFKIADVTGVYSVTLGAGTASFSLGTGNFSATCAGIGAITLQTVGLGGITASCIGAGAIALTTTTGLLSLTSGNLITLTATTTIRITALTTNFAGYCLFNRQVLVSGLLAGTGGASFSGGVKLNGAVNVTGNLTVAGTTKFTGSTSVTGPFTITGPTTVTGLGTFKGGLTVQGSITMTGSVNVKGPVAISGNTSCFGILAVSRQLRLFQGAQITGGVTVQGTTNLTGSVNVKGPISISGNTSCFGALYVSRQLRLFQGAQITGGLTVQGTTNLTGSVNVKGPISISGNTTCFGALYVSRQLRLFQGAQITGKLTALGPVDITGNTTVRGFTNLTGNCTITGTGTIQGKGTVRGGLEVSGGATINFGLNVNGSSKFTGPTSVIGKFTVSGQMEANGGLKVLGTSSFSGNFTASGIVTSNGGLRVTGLTTLTGGLTASGIVTANGGLNVTGIVSLKGATSVTGATTVSGLFTAQGGANITGAVGIQGPTNITGALAVQGPVNCSGAFTATGGAAITGITAITGATQITGALNVSGSFSTQGVATFVSSTYMLNGIGVTGGTTINTIGQRCDITGGKITLKSEVDAVNIIAPEGGFNIGSGFAGGVVGAVRIETQNGFTQFATGNIDIRTTTKSPYTGNGNITINTFNAYSGEIFINAKARISIAAAGNSPGQSGSGNVQAVSFDTSIVSSGGYTFKFPSTIGTANSIFLSGGSSDPLSWLAPGAANTFLTSDGTSISWTPSTNVTNWASPGAIGSTTPNTGAFTTLTATSCGISGNLFANSLNATNTTNVNPGIFVFNDGLGNNYGMDLGYNAASGRYRTRIFTPQAGGPNSGVGGDIALSTGIGGGLQSAYTDRLIVRGDTGTVEMTGNATVAGYLRAFGGPLPITSPGDGVSMGMQADGYAGIQINGTGSNVGYIDFSQNGTDYLTRIIVGLDKRMEYWADTHIFKNSAFSSTYLSLNADNTIVANGTAISLNAPTTANSLTVTSTNFANKTISTNINFGMVFCANRPTTSAFQASFVFANENALIPYLSINDGNFTAYIAGTCGVQGNLFANSAGSISTTTVNPAVTVYANSESKYGMDFGYNSSSGRYRTRIFSQNGLYSGDIALSTGFGTNQSDYTDRLIVRGDTGNIELLSKTTFTSELSASYTDSLFTFINTATDPLFTTTVLTPNLLIDNTTYTAIGKSLSTANSTVIGFKSAAISSAIWSIFNSTTNISQTFNGNINMVAPTTSITGNLSITGGNIFASQNIVEAVTILNNGNLALSSSSPGSILIRGGSGSIITLPDATTLIIGYSYTINNNSSNTATINQHNSGSVGVVGAGNMATVTCIGTASPNGQWDLHVSGLAPNTDWANPGAIGSTTPNTGAFTTLSATSTTTIGGSLTVSGLVSGLPVGNGVQMGIDAGGNSNIQLNSSTSVSYIDFSTSGVDFNSRILSFADKTMQFSSDSYAFKNTAEGLTYLTMNSGTTSILTNFSVAGTYGVVGDLSANSANAGSSTNLNPGVFVFNSSSGNVYGMDLGYNAGTNRYRNRIFCPYFGAGDIALSTGDRLGLQSDYTDRLIVRGDTGNVEITSNATVAGYLRASGDLPIVTAGPGVSMGIQSAGGYAGIQINGTGSNVGFIDFSQNGTDYLTRIIVRLDKTMEYWADTHLFQNAASTFTYLALNANNTISLNGPTTAHSLTVTSENIANKTISTNINFGMIFCANRPTAAAFQASFVFANSDASIPYLALNNGNFTANIFGTCGAEGDLFANSANAANVTTITPGVFVFKVSGDAYGMDLGFNAEGRARTRIFSPTSGIGGDIALSTGLRGTLQSAYTDRLIVRGDTGDVVITSELYIPSSSLTPLLIQNPLNASFTPFGAFAAWPANSNQTAEILFGRSADNYQAGKISFTARQPNTGTRGTVFSLGYTGFPFLTCDQFNTAYFLDAAGANIQSTITSTSRTGLVFSGGGAVTAKHFQSSDINRFRCIGNAGGAFPNGYFIEFLNESNGGVGSILYNGANTVYNSSSDYRLKTNIEPLSNPLGKILQLNPKSYTMIDNQMNSYGFIAHEVAEVIPDLVTGEKDAVDEEGNPRYQQIDYSRFTPYTVGAIKDLFSLIETLQSQVQTQQLQIETLQAQVSLLNQ